MAKTVNLKEAQAKYSIYLNKIDLAQGPLILEHEGEPVAAVVPIAEYREFEAWRERRVSPLPSPDDEWEQGRQAFERMRNELLKTHKGQFVAILNNQVVDADAEIGTLAKRVYARFGYRPIYMQKVTEQPRVARILSPRVVR
jgi:PHD/YefM family antitoxin component YafN of YafNO toxin-antitoxin module